MPTNPADYLSVRLQELRDAAEGWCIESLAHGDRDSADALERVGRNIQACLDASKHDLHTARERMGLRTAY
jgi:hypothetical protein